MYGTKWSRALNQRSAQTEPKILRLVNVILKDFHVTSLALSRIIFEGVNF